MSLTHSGTIEAAAGHYEVLAADSFIDIDTVVDPTPLLEKQPDLFIADWKGPTEVLALVEAGNIAAAGVLRYGQERKALEVYAVGAWRSAEHRQALKAAMRERVDARQAKLGAQQDGTVKPVPATVHWGAEPPTVEVKPNDPGVGVKGFRALVEKAHQQFWDDLKSPYGPLFPKRA